MFNIEKLKKEYEDISLKLSSEEILKNRDKYQQAARRFSFLEKIINMLTRRENYFKEKENLLTVISDNKEDDEVKFLAREELIKLENQIKVIEEEIEDNIFEADEPEHDIIIEIRAAAGGEESALFAAALYKMYSKYIEKKGWAQEVLNSNSSEIGGFKEVIFSVRGKGAYGHLKLESGVHRVQRVPATEAGGRIHTSTVTVAVLIEPKDIELQINSDDLKIDTFRASGAGGQHVNRTDSAVRITHLPTNMVVTCQDERSQIKNREKAMRVLKARLLEKMQSEKESKVTAARRIQIGSGERSEKIRTYNFPERRITDHRINFTVYRLEEVLEGDLEEIVKSLIKEERKKISVEKGLV